MPDALPEFVLTNNSFVTVAEGARLLSVPLRTAQRHAAKLGATDRQPGESGASLVRLVALARSTGKAIPSDDPGRDGGAGDVPNDRHGATNGAGVAQDDPVRDTLIEQLRAENARAQEDKAKLFDALDKAQETARGAVAELSELRREYNLLQAATRARRIAPGGMPDSAIIAPHGAESGDTGVSPLTTPTPGATPDPHTPTSAGTGGTSAAGGTGSPAPVPADNAAAQEAQTGTHAWWQFWKGKQVDE